MVECFTLDQEVAGLMSLTSSTVLCPRARHNNPCLVLAQLRKTSLDIADKLLTGTFVIKSNRKYVIACCGPLGSSETEMSNFRILLVLLLNSLCEGYVFFNIIFVE